MIQHVSSLGLSWRIREGSADAKVSRLEYLDFVVDGSSLGDAAGAQALDLIGCLGWGVNSEYQRGVVRQLLLDESSELETGRRLLYVCPLCGDIGCGALTAVVEREDDCFTWTQLGIEVNYTLEDKLPLDLDGYEEVGPFRFDASQYRETLLSWPLRPSMR